MISPHVFFDGSRHRRHVPWVAGSLVGPGAVAAGWPPEALAGRPQAHHSVLRVAVAVQQGARASHFVGSRGGAAWVSTHPSNQVYPSTPGVMLAVLGFLLRGGRRRAEIWVFGAAVVATPPLVVDVHHSFLGMLAAELLFRGSRHSVSRVLRAVAAAAAVTASFRVVDVYHPLFGMHSAELSPFRAREPKGRLFVAAITPTPVVHHNHPLQGVPHAEQAPLRPFFAVGWARKHGIFSSGRHLPSHPSRECRQTLSSCLPPHRTTRGCRSRRGRIWE